MKKGTESFYEIKLYFEGRLKEFHSEFFIGNGLAKLNSGSQHKIE